MNPDPGVQLLKVCPTVYTLGNLTQIRSRMELMILLKLKVTVCWSTTGFNDLALKGGALMKWSAHTNEIWNLSP